MPLTHKQQSRALTALVGVATLASLAACKPRQGYHPDEVPENHAEVHQPAYRGGEVEHGELDEPDPQADIESAEPPGRVGAAWSDPDGVPIEVTAVVIDVGLADACGIDKAKAFFEYDSAKLDAEARQTVAEIAACFDEGPLDGQALEIIGHADPRGTDAYNEKLGRSRAQSVADVLMNNGLSKRRLEVESHGEEHAHEDADKWPRDRRVDLRVGE